MNRLLMVLALVSLTACEKAFNPVALKGPTGPLPPSIQLVNNTTWPSVWVSSNPGDSAKLVGTGTVCFQPTTFSGYIFFASAANGSDFRSVTWDVSTNPYMVVTATTTGIADPAPVTQGCTP